jgi:hypothetical protein
MYVSWHPTLFVWHGILCCLVTCLYAFFPCSTMQQVTASWHLQRGPGWLTPSSLVRISQWQRSLLWIEGQILVLSVSTSFSAAFHVLNCTLACHVNRFSRIFHDGIVGRKVSQGVDSQGAVPTKVICFTAVFGATLWVVRFVPHAYKPKDDCVCKIVGNCLYLPPWDSWSILPVLSPHCFSFSIFVTSGIYSINLFLSFLLYIRTLSVDICATSSLYFIPFCYCSL